MRHRAVPTRPLIAALLALLAAPAAAQQPAPAPGNPFKPGVPGVQYPMSRLVPDAEYAVSGSPDWLAMGEDQVWTNSRAIDIVTRMNPYTGETVAVVPVKNPCSGLVIAAGTLWVPSCTEGTVYRIDTKTNQVAAKVAAAPAHNEGGIAYGAGSVWLPSDPQGVVARLDPATNGVAARIAVAPGSYTAVFGYNRVWVSSTERSLVSVIDPATNTVVAEIPVDTAPRFMAVGEGFVWTLNQAKGTVTKIDPVTMTVAATIEAGVPGGGGDIAAGEGAVWVTAREIPVTRIDAATNRVTHQFVGPGGDAIRVLHGSVWLSNGRWSNVWRFPAEQVRAIGEAGSTLTSSDPSVPAPSAAPQITTLPKPAPPVAPPASAFLDPGVLPATWTSGGPNCLEVPDWHVHEYNPSFFILRQSGCTHYEKPFLFLIFGRDRALLEDTGAGNAKTAPVVMDLVSRWAKRHAKTEPVPLIVVHSHSHGDHTAGDAGFEGLPHVQLVEATVPALQAAFGLAGWPEGSAEIDLGGRIVDLIPIPGHDAASIALYDRQTGVLLTGDSFYPGRLYVGQDEFPAFAASTQRLVDFTADRPVAHILGTHIEQTRTPFVDYPRGTAYQPEEHALELTRGTLLELNDAIARLNGTLERVALRDVILQPRAPRR